MAGPGSGEIPGPKCSGVHEVAGGRPGEGAVHGLRGHELASHRANDTQSCRNDQSPIITPKATYTQTSNRAGPRSP